MKKVILLFLGVSITSAIIFSCTKNSDNTPTTNYSYISQGPWVMSHFWSKTSVDSPWVLLDTTISVCKKDNVTTFNNNSRFTVDEGKIKCDTTKYAPQILLSGTWSLQNNQSTLVTGSALGSQTYTIEILNSSQLQISYQDATRFYRELYTH